MLFSKRSLFIANGLICTSLVMSLASPAGSTVPAPQAPATAPCTVPESVDPVDAFKTPIDDPRTLAFIAIEERLPAKLQADVAKKASADPSIAVEGAIDSHLSDPCTLAEIRTRETRLLYVLSERWPNEDAGAFEKGARYAIAALFLGDSISPVTRDAALAVFDTNMQEIDTLIRARESPPAPAPSQQTCESEPPQTTYAVSPTYPEEARLARETGTVSVMVMLDTHGFVRLARYYSSAVKTADDHGLIPSAIISAAASDYLPENVGCRRVAGTYLFRVDYSAR
jgi:hypothetical protein